ncbi:TVP38/TMEM64 family protein [Salinadaptatus halalkaliphilus]|uniref:TVP38/TMEM64 family protein n=1 Tax=Salinadaptatus halalkaliphilus TaxID=2419781 RepID=A0A4S3TN02_9EURY|nr:VTT domain-containing protein [Salinadaptatus halalkaliphilus]THE65622.1 TVP38/TMEM64 family protein [Salinadaptatus halalkaliphilus]
MSSVSTRAIIGLLVVSAVLAAGMLVSPSTAFGFLESLTGDPYLFAVTIAGLYLVRPLFAWPTTPLAVVVGYGYGVTVGVPVALVGLVVTVVPVFLVARRVVAREPASRPVSQQADGLVGDLFERASDVAGRYYNTAGPIRGVAVSRLVPIPSDVSTCAAAASEVRLRQFVLGTVLGELPWTIAAVVVGASAATLAADGLGELGLVVTVACLLAAAILLAGPIYRLVRNRSTRDTSQPLEY